MTDTPLAGTRRQTPVPAALRTAIRTMDRRERDGVVRTLGAAADRAADRRAAATALMWRQLAVLVSDIASERPRDPSADPFTPPEDPR